MDNIRLQKFISNCGYTSRRKAEELIKNGSVKVNNSVITTLGSKINPIEDTVSINGKIISNNDNSKIYIKLNKPIGYITTSKDQFNRPCVLDLVQVKERIYPIGRLDYNTSGLLLLTNDGVITNRLTHPRYKVYKTYIAKVKGTAKEGINSFDVQKLIKGVDIGNYITAPCKVDVLKTHNYISVIRISIREGKNRQIRRMFDSLDYKVMELNRISFGEIKLDNLKYGEWTYLSPSEIKYLKKIGG